MSHLYTQCQYGHVDAVDHGTYVHVHRSMVHVAHVDGRRSTHETACLNSPCIRPSRSLGGVLHRVQHTQLHMTGASQSIMQRKKWTGIGHVRSENKSLCLVQRLHSYLARGKPEIRLAPETDPNKHVRKFDASTKHRAKLKDAEATTHAT